MDEATAFLGKYGLANTSGPRHVARRSALVNARAELDRLRAIEAAARALLLADGKATTDRRRWDEFVAALEVPSDTEDETNG